MTSQRKRSAAAADPNRFDVGVRTGTRRGPTFTAVHDWVLYSDVSPTAKALYAILRSHVNGQRRDDLTWTSSLALATILGYSAGDKIKKFEDELVNLGAISIIKEGMPAKKFYTVEQFPPPGYTGPVSSSDWYDRNGPAVTARLEAERAAREARRAAAKSKNEPPAAASVVPPKWAGQAAPKSAGHAALDPAGHVPPGRARELTLGVTPGGSVTKSRTPSPSGATAAAPSEQTTAEQNPIDSSEIENQEGYAADGYPLDLTDWETALVAELVELRPDWLPRAVRIAVGHSQVRVRTANDPGLVRRAFLLAAADRARPRDGYKGTWSPNRMFAAGCPFWAQAVEEVVPVSAGERVGRPDPAVPDASVGDQAAVRPVVSGREPPTAEYLAWREKEKARLGAKR